MVKKIKNDNLLGNMGIYYIDELFKN